MRQQRGWAVGMILVATVALSAAAPAEEAEQAHASALDLSDGVRELLRAEMAQIAIGMQQITVALPLAGWEGIRETAIRIHDSYIMNSELTQEQAHELEHALPEHFQRLDQQLHDRAARLAHAAEEHDAEQVVYHYSRMMESCTTCHAAYARDRFPDFERVAPVAHQH